MVDLKARLQETLGGNYTVERELGGGGMSRVFIAEEVALERKVVLKVLLPELAATVNIERFRREVLFGAKLQHPHIVPVLAAGITDGLPYYTMPFIEGESLRARLGRSKDLAVDEAARILRDVLNALSYAHEHGVVHRDVKPDNVLLTARHAMVTDFGVAKALNAATNASSSLTSVGVVVGTPAYMSPEQAAADQSTDHRTDIYSVGVMAYEMLTGRQPYSARSPQAMLAAHAIEKPEPIDKRMSSAPRAVCSLIMRALEKDPADRPQSAAEMLGDLERAMTNAAIASPRWFGSWSPYRSRSTPWFVGGTIAAIGFLAFAGFRAYRARLDLDPNRVIIAPFENRTGDSRLDPLTAISTDWVTRGINETGLVEVAAFTPERDALGKPLPSELEPVALTSRARALGARHFVSGAFFMTRDSVEFHAEIRDATDGRLIGSVPRSIASRNDPMPAVNTTRARIMSALAAMTGTELGPVGGAQRPPLYPAYQEFVRGEQGYLQADFRRSIPYYQRAYALDGTYLIPLIREAYAYMNLGNCAASDSLGEVVSHKRDYLSPYEDQYLERVLAWCRGDWEAAYVAAKRMAALAPKSSFAQFIAARSLIPINHLREAAEALEKLDWRKRHPPNYYLDLAYVWHKLGNHKRELEIARFHQARDAGSLESLELTIRALSALGRVEEVRQLVGRSLAMPSRPIKTPADVMRAASDELTAHGSPDAGRQIGKQLLLWIRARPAREQQDTSLVLALIRAEEYTEAHRVARRFLAEHPNDLTATAYAGVAAAWAGDRAAAERASSILGSFAKPYMLGKNFYFRALIAALLGQSDEAVAFLREAFRNGVSYSAQGDDVRELLPLRGYAPFNELMRPKD